MNNAAYANLRARFCAIAEHPDTDGYARMSAYSYCHHMDALVMEQSSANAIGHLFLYQFKRELSGSDVYLSPGIHTIGQEVFRWSLQFEDWSTAAWLLCDKELQGLDRTTVYPYVLPEMAEHMPEDWPPSYRAALQDHALVENVIAWNCSQLCAADEESMQQETGHFREQIRAACYFGPGHGLYGTAIANAWLQLRDDDYAQPAFSMQLLHHHPQLDSLRRLVHNQSQADRFWVYGDCALLDAMHPFVKDDFQPWYWLFNMGYLHTKHVHASTWTLWWNDTYPEMVKTMHFWLDMHTIAHGIVPHQKMSTAARLLNVRTAQDLWRRQLTQTTPISQYALPEAFQETPMG